ncbi:nucleotidyltransferase domain-containing protein [Actinoplanes bogorensis]|uniref:Nucleotidyltransferase domain-containing protein n=1 Tax=Paractinoplanes bogorensis TaxID=1610840 RepID=A0ABS5YNE0_9ACTN|nr:nucleotidyltransferase domain-containing protein [Actinoplanes bogorensis]MBU2664978.1 nucleotidyltransferase domain-containing protein [Actinoplanes bogorensis]
MNPIDDARALIEERYADCVWALLTGSVLGPARTAGSDLDIVVLIDAEPGYRASLRYRGWPVELFVHTRERLEGFMASELAARKPSTHRMLAHGAALRGDPSAWITRGAEVLAAGPGPLSPAESERLRYGLTDLLDDYAHVVDPGERTVIAATLWTETAQAALLAAGRWMSGGKWLLRELRDLDPALAERWLAARDAPAALATEVLDRAGGPLFDGYRAM